MKRPRIIARIIVFAVNVTLWASGILLIVFGSIGVASPTATVKLLNLIDGVSNVTDIIDVTKYVEGAAIFMIVLGCFLFLLGFNGCHGVVQKNKKSIVSYMGLMVCALLVEIAIIIYGAIYPGTITDSIQADMGTSLNETYSKIALIDSSPYFKSAGQLEFSSDQTAQSWQYLEFETACCGAVSYEDYGSFDIFITDYVTPSQSAVPMSCCKLKSADSLPTSTGNFTDYSGCIAGTASAINSNPCSDTVDKMIYQFNLIAIILSSCLIGAELLGLIFAAQLSSGHD